MPVQLLLNQAAGPLPVSNTFQAMSDAPVVLEVSGSVWSQSTNTIIGIKINIDGVSVGTAQVFSNGNATHRTVVPAYIQLELTPGQHTIQLVNETSTTVSDFNDFYSAVIHY
jgi:hypothetical protein